MANHQNIITVSVQLESPTTIIKKQTISEAEQYFISKRDNENNHSKKVEFDRVCALLKWAECCNTTLVKMRNADRKLMVYLVFSTLRDMMEFCDHMFTNVPGATMK